jgi:hypothetical protein
MLDHPGSTRLRQGFGAAGEKEYLSPARKASLETQSQQRKSVNHVFHLFCRDGAGEIQFLNDFWDFNDYKGLI